QPVESGHLNHGQLGLTRVHQGDCSVLRRYEYSGRRSASSMDAVNRHADAEDPKRLSCMATRFRIVASSHSIAFRRPGISIPLISAIIVEMTACTLSSCIPKVSRIAA